MNHCQEFRTMQINGFSSIATAQQAASSRAAEKPAAEFGKALEATPSASALPTPSSFFSSQAMTVLQQDEIKFFHKSFSDAYSRAQNVVASAGGSLALQV